MWRVRIKSHGGVMLRGGGYRTSKKGDRSLPFSVQLDGYLPTPCTKHQMTARTIPMGMSISMGTYLLLNFCSFCAG